VKEEKILFIAQETGDNKQIVDAIREIINACTFNALKVDLLPIFDIEYIFYNKELNQYQKYLNLKRYVLMMEKLMLKLKLI
jgi:hypothetical protein